MRHEQPDAEVIADAMAVGGPAFVEVMFEQATDEAERLAPWSGLGPEPPDYRDAFAAAARRIVAARRANLAEPDR